MKNLLIRAARTYAQTLLGLLVASPLLELDLATAKVLLISALPAALSVLQNGLEEGGVNLGPRG